MQNLKKLDCSPLDYKSLTKLYKNNEKILEQICFNLLRHETPKQRRNFLMK